MVTELFADQPSTTVSSGGTDAPASGTSESWTVASSSSFPAAATGVSQFHIADAAVASSSEIILVTNVSGTTWTVTRGAESTTPVAHIAGFTVYQVVTAGWLNTVALQSSNAGTAFYALTSGTAYSATSSLTAGTAYYAFTAGTAYSATSAASAVTAGTASYSLTSGTAYASTTSSGTVTSALTAGTAYFATSAGSALTAGTAFYSLSSGTAAYALTSGTAFASLTAGTASYANSAGTAFYALTSGTAFAATSAVTAGTASYSLTSGTAFAAAKAGTAYTAGGLQSATTNVITSAAAAPSTGQVLTATSSTAADWAAPSAALGSGSSGAKAAITGTALTDIGPTYSVSGGIAAAGVVYCVTAFINPTANTSADSATIGVYWGGITGTLLCFTSFTPAITSSNDPTVAEAYVYFSSTTACTSCIEAIASSSASVGWASTTGLSTGGAENITLGWSWASVTGSPSATPEFAIAQRLV